MIEFKLEHKSIGLAECAEIKKVYELFESLQYANNIDECKWDDFKKINLYIPIGRILKIDDTNYAFSFRHNNDFLDLVINTKTNTLKYIIENSGTGGENHISVPLNAEIYRAANDLTNNKVLSEVYKVLMPIIEASRLLLWLNQVII